ncbi:MAG: hypothetical protein PHS54_05705, partial [Clostridia bacterium]|nr:hypothetical protein [Clostridia bacterium]
MNKLNIKTISCCGANELLKEKDLINFLKKNPNVEIGVGVSSNKCMEDMPRYVWVADLFEALQKEKNIKNLALHVNGDWNKEIIVEGKLPKNLNYFLYRSYKKMIRMQLNFVGSGYEFNDINPENFADLIESSYAEIKFILPYNEKSSKFIKALYSKTQWFDVLYDKSFGFGKLSNEYDSTFAGKLLQGY